MKISLAAATLVFHAVFAAAQPQVGIDKLVPTLEQLGTGWTSNRVVVLVDSLSSPKERADPGESGSWLDYARDLLRRDPRREAYAVLRYYRQSMGLYPTNYLVFVTRWKSIQDIPSDWGRDQATKETPTAPPRVGEEVRCSQRHGMHNNIDFRRGNYAIGVEGAVPYGWEDLKRLAEALDDNFLRAEKSLTNNVGSSIRHK